MAQTLPAASQFLDSWNLAPAADVEVAIFPSFVHLSKTREKIDSRKLSLAFGGQDCSTEEKGAFTGEISAGMLKEMGAKYVLIGHSERRKRVPETTSSLSQKLDQAFKAGLIPVYCLGETEAERNAGKLLEILKAQASLVTNLSQKFLVAYEPVWAIGTGKVATEADIAAAHESLKSMLPAGVAILYGGSVSAQNAGGILKVQNVDGLLVGGASLKVEDFQKIAGG